MPFFRHFWPKKPFRTSTKCKFGPPENTKPVTSTFGILDFPAGCKFRHRPDTCPSANCPKRILADFRTFWQFWDVRKFFMMRSARVHKKWCKGRKLCGRPTGHEFPGCQIRKNCIFGKVAKNENGKFRNSARIHLRDVQLSRSIKMSFFDNFPDFSEKWSKNKLILGTNPSINDR